MASERLLEDAGELLAENTRHAVLSGRGYRFSIPSQERYRFQWFWDSCFHAIVWARVDVERACDELRGLIALQAPNGRIPHVVFWDDETRLADGLALPGKPWPRELVLAREATARDRHDPTAGDRSSGRGDRRGRR